MKIEELSVGDWVRDGNGIIAKVRGIENWNDGYILNVQTVSGSICALSATGALPIHLTPEILEKNGFKRKQYTIDIPDVQEIGYDGYRHILCQEGVQYDIILVDSCGGYFDLEIESSCHDEDGDRILISSRLSLDYVEFVHQLQHALRLAGIEKEIEI